jgi:hypothetical protein
MEPAGEGTTARGREHGRRLTAGRGLIPAVCLPCPVKIRAPDPAALRPVGSCPCKNPPTVRLLAVLHDFQHCADISHLLACVAWPCLEKESVLVQG